MANQRNLATWVRNVRQHDANGTLGYHSRVLVEHRAVCVTVPKSACSRIKLTLHLLEGNQEPRGYLHDIGRRLASIEDGQIVDMLTSSAWFRFCFVRNPYDRLLSAYKTQIGNTWNQEYKWLKDQIKTAFAYPPDDGPDSLVAFRDFVRYLHDAGKESGLLHDGHFNIQTRVLVPELIPYDFIGRFEVFQRDFEWVLERLGASPEVFATASSVQNASTKVSPPAIAYDRELADIAFSIYECDFETFGYRRNSWMHEQFF